MSSRLAACLAFSATLAAGPAMARDLAIVGAKVYTAPEGVTWESANVLVHDGKIAAVGPGVRPPAGAEIIDGNGLVVTAGFWNSHVHLISPAIQKKTAPAADLSAEMTAMLTRWGFTSVFDIASGPGEAIALRKRIAAGEVTGPMILTVDLPFNPNNGVPIYARDLMKGSDVVSPTAGAARATSQIRAGADGVKLFTGSIVGPPVGVLPMPVDQASAVVAAAHKLGKPAFAHPSNNVGLNVAIESGVDVLAHTTPDGGPWPADMVGRLKAHNMALIPTLSLWRFELERNKAPQAALDRLMKEAQAQLKAYAYAGGQILFGTDVGYTSVFDTAEEFRLMAGAGLPYTEVLASLTTAPAARFGFPRKGTVAAGQDGDLVVLNADPRTDPAAFAKVRLTIRDGRVIYDAAKR
jgi:imidazolonepropionase-like amidohydrolase